jgi:hypothetical protein
MFVVEKYALVYRPVELFSSMGKIVGVSSHM